MLLDILNKIFLVLFFMSTFNVIRHSYYFIQAWVKSNGDRPEKYIITNNSLWILSMSLAYIISSIIIGVCI
jgi:hypothetical protein